MLAIKIENKEFESQFLDFVKNQKETIEGVTLDALKKFMNASLNKKNKYLDKKVRSLRGVFNRYADLSKLEKENNAWKEHLEDKFNKYD